MIETDYYGICEDAAIQLLRETEAFAWQNKNKQVTKSDDRFLDEGFDRFAITYPGAFPTVFASTDTSEVQWEILLDILTRWNKSEAEAWSIFKSYRSKVFNLFNLSYEGRYLTNPTNQVRTAGIVKVNLVAQDRPRYIPVDPESPQVVFSHIAQVMVLTVTQNINKEIY